VTVSVKDCGPWNCLITKHVISFCFLLSFTVYFHFIVKRRSDIKHVETSGALPSLLLSLVTATGVLLVTRHSARNGVGRKQ
jgi:hypothetical protein